MIHDPMFLFQTDTGAHFGRKFSFGPSYESDKGLLVTLETANFGQKAGTDAFRSITISSVDLLYVACNARTANFVINLSSFGRMKILGTWPLQSVGLCFCRI